MCDKKVGRNGNQELRHAVDSRMTYLSPLPRGEGVWTAPDI